MTCRKTLGLLSFLLQAAVHLLVLQPVVAQGAGVGLETHVDRRVIRLGDPAKLTLTVTLPEGSSLDASHSWPDSIPPFEWLTPVRTETTVVDGGLRMSFSRAFTSFDSGRWTMPSVAFVIDGANVGSDTVGIEVNTVPLAVEDYRDIGDIFEAEQPQDSIGRALPIVLALSVLLGLSSWLYLRRRRSGSTPSSGGILPSDSFDAAMRELDLLSEDGLADQGAAKEFHASLYGVLRGYLENALGWRVTSLTTGDLLAFLAARCADRDAVARLASSLRLSDAARFAKHLPSVEESRRCASDIRSFIIHLHENARGS